MTDGRKVTLSWFVPPGTNFETSDSSVTLEHRDAAVVFTRLVHRTLKKTEMWAYEHDSELWPFCSQLLQWFSIPWKCPGTCGSSPGIFNQSWENLQSSWVHRGQLWWFFSYESLQWGVDLCCLTKTSANRAFTFIFPQLLENSELKNKPKTRKPFFLQLWSHLFLPVSSVHAALAGIQQLWGWAGLYSYQHRWDMSKGSFVKKKQ